MARAPKSSNTPSKAQLVRDAIAKLGDDAKPVAIQAEIQDNAGVEITTAMIASYKSNMKKASGSGGSGRKSSSGGSVNVNDLELIKGLVGRLGVNQLHALINVLAK